MQFIIGRAMEEIKTPIITEEAHIFFEWINFKIC